MPTYGTKDAPPPPEHPVERAFKRWNSTTAVLGIALASAIGIIAILVARPAPPLTAHLKATLFTSNGNRMPLEVGGGVVDENGDVHALVSVLNTDSKVFAKGIVGEIKACVDCISGSSGVAHAGPFTFVRGFQALEAVQPRSVIMPPIDVVIRKVPEFARYVLLTFKLACETCDNPDTRDVLRVNLVRKGDPGYDQVPACVDAGSG